MNPHDTNAWVDWVGSVIVSFTSKTTFSASNTKELTNKMTDLYKKLLLGGEHHIMGCFHVAKPKLHVNAGDEGQRSHDEVCR